MNPWTQNRHDRAFRLVTRRISDARVRDQVLADAREEDEDRTTNRVICNKAIDDDEARARYDDNDEGGTRGGRE